MPHALPGLLVRLVVCGKGELAAVALSLLSFRDAARVLPVCRELHAILRRLMDAKGAPLWGLAEDGYAQALRSRAHLDGMATFFVHAMVFDLEGVRARWHTLSNLISFEDWRFVGRPRIAANDLLELKVSVAACKRLGHYARLKAAPEQKELAAFAVYAWAELMSHQDQLEWQLVWWRDGTLPPRRPLGKAQALQVRSGEGSGQEPGCS